VGDPRLAGHQASRAAGQVDCRNRLERLPGRAASKVDSYLEGLTKIRKNRKGHRVRPLKAVTLRTRRAELQGAARMAVKAGVPVENLNSLAALLAPEVAEQVLEAYCTKNGEKPKLYTIDLAGRFLSIARETKCLNEADCQRLNEMREVLDEERPEGFTDKNATLIRQVLAPNIWDLAVNLPLRMMAEARRDRARAPVQSAVKAQIAVAIAILTIVPVRIKNLTEIRLGLNLSKPGGPGSDYWLNFPDYDVKNRMKLEYVLDEYITPLINEYVHDFRPTLLRGRTRTTSSPVCEAVPRAKSPSAARSPSVSSSSLVCESPRTSSGTPPAPSFSRSNPETTNWCARSWVIAA
jgi:hypothetical protein